MKAVKIAILAAFVLFALNAQADSVSGGFSGGPIIVKPKDPPSPPNPPSKPRAPMQVPVECYLYEDGITIVSKYGIFAEVNIFNEETGACVYSFAGIIDPDIFCNLIGHTGPMSAEITINGTTYQAEFLM